FRTKSWPRARGPYVPFRLRGRHTLPGTRHDLLRLGMAAGSAPGGDVEDPRIIALQQNSLLRLPQALPVEHQRADSLSIRRRAADTLGFHSFQRQIFPAPRPERARTTEAWYPGRCHFVPSL